ncbi:hypothetical protein [Qipengyuania sp.]|uniref:hypothetical protein n=1 Tax=Qipengyuania sp. TaxID=2004515 RepID=UPI003AF714DE
MDPDLLLIFGFILTILMIVMPMAYLFQKRAAEHEERKLELRARKAEAEAAMGSRGSADYRKFEDRLRVLERIATDGNHNLALQIEQLRDLQEIENTAAQGERAL